MDENLLTPEEDAAILAEALTDVRVEIRRRAAHRLLALGESAGKVILEPHAGVFGSSLRDPDAKVRALAAQLLTSLGPAAAGQARDLAFALRDDSNEVRKLACEALALMLPRYASNLAAAFVAWSEGGEINAAEVALSALEALAALGLQKANELVLKLQQNLVERTLVASGQPIAGNLTAVLASREWSDYGHVEKAWAALLAFGAQAMEELAAKLLLVQAGNSEVQLLAAQAFLTAGQQASVHAGALTTSLLHKNVDVRRLVAEALAELQPGPASAATGQVQSLVSALTDSDAEVRQHVARALARGVSLPGPYRDAVSLHAEAIAAALRDDSVQTCRFILQVLGTIEPAAIPFVGVLAPVLQDPENMEACEKAAEWASDRGAHGLASALTDYLTLMPAAALNVPTVTATSAVLRQVSAESSWEVKTTAALAALAVARTVSGAALTDSLVHGDQAARRRAAEVLGALGPLAAPVADSFVTGLEDRDWEVRRGSARAIEFANWQSRKHRPGNRPGRPLR